jgi:hypothetical protein
MPTTSPRDSELREVLTSLQLEQRDFDRQQAEKRGDGAITATWALCLVAVVIDLVVGYVQFTAQNSAPKQIAVAAYSAFGMAGSYILARCVHELITATRRRPNP